MTKLELEIHDDVLSVINKIKNIDDHGIELTVPEGSVLFDSILNLKLLEKEADRLDKTLHFSTSDYYGLNLISNLKSEESSDDFISQEYPVTEIQPELEEPKPEKKKKFKRKSFAVVTSRFKSRKAKIVKVFVILLILLGLGAFGAVQAMTTIPKASVIVTVNSQPLTKSVQVKVVKDGQNNAEQRTLRGYAVDSLITKTEKIPTTGEKLIGDPAEGEIKIFNKTTSDKRLRKGHRFTYREGNTRLEFTLDSEVTVPKRSEDPDTKIITPGEVEASITAADIGEDYNIKRNEELEVDDYEQDDVTAETTVNFTGGKSETIKVVTEEDKLALTQLVLDKNPEDLEEGLQSKTSADRKYIKGSYETQVVKEEFNHEVDDEAEELEVTQEILTVGLSYSDNELEGLLNKLVEELIPQGYTLSSQDKDIKVEVLGNSDSTIASPTEADLQVTIKAFVVPILEQGDLQQQLTNKPISEAQRILGGINSIQTYELELDPNIPFFQRMPQNPENIEVTIQKQ